MLWENGGDPRCPRDRHHGSQWESRTVRQRCRNRCGPFFVYRFPGRKVVSSKAALVFRVAAVAEAFSWAGLLIGMYLKYVLHSAHEGGVPVLGMVHGIVFVVYVLTSLLVFKPLAWKPKTLALALLASV